MTKTRGLWFTATLAAALLAGVAYLQANQEIAPAPVPQPLVTEALVDDANATLTMNGYDFSAGLPTVTLGMTELAVASATPSEVVTGLPALLPGTYLLALTWNDGAGAVFYLTIGAGGAVSTGGPAGPQGEPSPVLSTGLGYPVPSAADWEDDWNADSADIESDHGGATNTHFGTGALTSVTGGKGNSAYGQNSLYYLTTGVDNAGFGRSTLRTLTTGSGNLAVGTTSLLRATTASFNVGIGTGTLKSTLAGQHNVAIGAEALLVSQGDRNIGIGRDALRTNSTGSDNIAVGFNAGRNNRSGSNNVYFGSIGVNGESGTIRIGTEGVHTKTYLAGEIVGNFVAVYQ